MNMYKSGYTLHLYQILEDDLVDFLKYIPIDYYPTYTRNKIFSPKLSELLIRIGSQIDVFFRNWDIVRRNNASIAKEKFKFGNYKVIERYIKLNGKEIKIIATDEILTPFKDWTKNDPTWWKAYNNVKHDGFINKEKGNLFNVIESLSALFLLNCIHDEIKMKLIEYGYKKVDIDTYDTIIRKKNYFDPYAPYITSKLFEFGKEIETTYVTLVQ